MRKLIECVPNFSEGRDMTTKTIRAGATLALLLGSASPLAAQSTCAGIGDDGVWIGGAYWFTSSTSLANPAVTLARSLTDTFAGIAPESVPMFVLMQLAGLAIALVIIKFIAPQTANQ